MIVGGEERRRRDRRVAVVGIGCRLPGARDPRQYFRNLRAGVSSIREITPDRWDPAELYSPDISEPNKSISKWCGLIDDPFTFDHAFFKVSPREAKQMDPQQRLLLEETWRCIEDSGIPLADLQRRRTSVYVGVMARDHLQRVSDPEAQVESHSALGGYDCLLANRLSHVLGLRGASFSIDAACASSLVAVHSAVEALVGGDTDYALAGGVSLDLHPWKYISFSKARMLSPEGRCKTFDKDADGYVPGEGVAMVILRRLEDAERDGDHIYGVVCGSAVNHGGHRLTVTAPTVDSQVEVVSTAVERAGFDPRTVTYVEAHGTGTSLGDPIEVEALTRVFRPGGHPDPAGPWCWLGSVKTNIGHLEAAAGVAGLIKVLMMMEARKVPPSLNLRTPNPLIDFAASPFRLVREEVDWEGSSGGAPLRAGISSFGMGGVNSHLVVEEYRAAEVAVAAGGGGALLSEAASPPLPFILSGRTRESLEALLERWRGFAAEGGVAAAETADVCCTLATGRQSFGFRMGRLVSSREEIQSFLESPPTAADAVPERSWWLGVGEVTPPPAPVLHRWLAEAPLAPVMEELEAEASAAGRERLERLRAGETGPGESCLYAYLLVRVFARLGFEPAAVTTTGRGLWAGLAAAGILDWEAAAARAAGEAEGNADRAAPRPPTVPFVDPVSGQTIPPYRLDASYLDALLGGLETGEATAAALLAKARLLVGSQYTFRSNLGEWNRLLRERGLAEWAVLEKGSLPAAPHESPRVTLLWVLAVHNALDRLHRKWSLSGERRLDDPRLGELLDLLLDEILSPDDVLELVTGGGDGRAAVAERAAQRSRRVDPARPYTLLREHSRVPRELANFAVFSAAALGGDSLPAVPEGTGLLFVGEGGGEAPESVVVASGGGAAGDPSLARPLLDLWLAGVDVEWGRFFAGRRYRRRPLPTCVFARTEHGAQEGLPRRPSGAPRTRSGEGQGSEPEVASPAESAAPELLDLRPRWVPEDIAVGQEPSTDDAGVVLVFERRRGAAAFGAPLLRALGAREVIRVRPGSRVREEAPESWTVRPTEKADYVRVLEALERRGSLPSRIVHLWSLDSGGGAGDALEPNLETGVCSLLLLTQALMQVRPGAEVRMVYAYPHDGGVAEPELAAAEGLARCIRRESSSLWLRTLAVDAAAEDALLWRWVGRELGATGQSAAVRCDATSGEGSAEGLRLVKRYVEVEPPAQPEGAGVRPGSVVLISGGAGGLGLTLAEHLLTTEGVRVALAGRSPLRDEVAERLSAYDGGGGPRALYFQADVSQPDQARELVRAVRDRLGALTGVIHAAGVLRDRLLLAKTLDQFREVLAPKVLGAVNLDEATLAEPLDFFLLFSSLVAVTGNVGQADYAFANSFLDAFVEIRERRRAARRRCGHTVSINWPLWEGGGMRVREGAATIFTPERGLLPLPAGVGLAALDAALAGPAGQRVLLYGRREPALELLGEGQEAVGAAEPRRPAPREPRDPAAIQAYALTYLKQVFAELLEVPEAELDPSLGLDQYGFDSILITQFNARVERELGSVSQTLLFECRTLAQAAAQLARQQAPELEARLASGTLSRPAAGDAPAVHRGRPAAASIQSAAEDREGTENGTAEDGVAIIGLSGRYPMAADLEEFWRNLAQGRDCISEIPLTRWDWRQRFTDDPEAALEGRLYSKWGGFVSGVDRFDPLFFSVSPREAELMDPQERLFLETAWETFEDAGYPPSRLGDPASPDGRAVGVFVAVTTLSYLLWGPDEWRKGNPVIPTSTPWSIANRVSYQLDLRGLSMPVDTACASSLTAVHLACRSLAAGECRMALVGAVNLYLHPSKYEWLCQMQMLSRKGRCHAFGAAADGFVPGEGVGAVLLKPLAHAVADGDRILGVVKGTAVNHGGRTNGFTVPDPNAQARLVEAALRDAGVSPRTLGYIEAHGTGTALGDPIEIAGLTKVFAAFEADREPGRCAVGSVKSNIGHLESAAGLAGLTKVLLQLRHRQLVPSLHAEQTNPRIDFAATPFRVQRELVEWVPRRVDGSPLPLRAGISSFGAGGGNAHVVVEEYAGAQPAPRGEPRGEHVLTLSAKDEGRLREHCRRMADHLSRHRGDFRLSEVAYQLQVRREPLERRLAFVATDLEEAVGRLRAVAAGRPAEELGERCWLGGGPGSAGAPPETVEEALERRDLGALAAGWAAGAEVPWEALHEGPVRSVTLPSYPFAGERYWVPQLPETAGPGAARPEVLAVPDRPAGRGIHPFLDNAASGGEAPSFSVELTGEEFFLADHFVDDDEIFPAVGYIEMARAAMAAVGRRVRRVRNNVWSSAIAVDRPRRIHIDLAPSAAGEGSAAGWIAAYEVYSLGPDGERIVHGQGRVEEDAAAAEAPGRETLDVAEIRERCPQRLTAADLYPRLHRLGLRLGASYQGIRQIHLGEHEALSEIHLPEHLHRGFNRFVLHPSILDSCLQGSLGLITRRDPETLLHIPFTIGDVEIRGGTPERCFAHVILRSWTPDAKKFDVRVADAQGRVVLEVRDFWLRPWQRAGSGAAVQGTAGVQETAPGVVFRPVWTEAPVETGNETAAGGGVRLLFAPSAAAGRRLAAEIAGRSGSSSPRTWIVTAGEGFQFVDSGEQGDEVEIDPDSGDDFAALLAASGGGPWEIVFAWPRGAFAPWENDVRSQLDTGLWPLSRLLRALFTAQDKAPVRLLVVFPAAAAHGHPTFQALGAFLRTAGRESSRLTHRLVELPVEALEALAAGRRGAAETVTNELLAVWEESREVRHRDGRRQVKRWEQRRLEGGGRGDGSPLRRQGVYVVTGGAGGLGLVLSHWLASRLEARLVLAGRSAADGRIERALESLRAAGGEALYVEADVSRAEGAARAVSAARDSFGAVHGIFHCAGVLRDALLVKKSEADLEAVLAPKLRGVLHLDEATHRDDLDLFVSFSSIAAVTGSVGQAGYAYANSFLDAFAEWREGLRRAGVRSGPSLSLQWPLWRDGGMGVDGATEELLERDLGLRPLATETGLVALEAMLAGPPGPALFVPGDGVKIRRLLGETERSEGSSSEVRPAQDPSGPEAPAAGNAGDLGARLVPLLIEEVAAVVKLDPSRVDPDSDIGGYGFDSIAFTRLANHLNKALDADLTPATFFEHTTVAALAGHLLETRGAQIAPRLAAHAPREASGTPEASETVETPGAVEPDAPGAPPEPQPHLTAPAVSSSGGGREPIAVIGMHGMMPGSEDLAELWEHLDQGRDLVTEIPAERWDWREYFGDPQKESGKTYSKWGGFLRQVDKFDARFFGISPREAELMDPQQRLFLETVYKTVEEAGYKPSDLSRGKTGLFVGVATHDYYDLLRQAEIPVEAYTTTGLFHAILANRVSFLLDWKGPSFPIDTACSSSLVALRSAIEAIWAGSCDVAIAGGVNLLLAPMIFISFARAGMLSPSGRSKTFDASADGYVRGEGVGALLLKPLTRALEDGDHIHAVVRGSAINHGGRVNTLTTPNPKAQAELLVRAFEEGGVDPESVGYMEVHGTGTALGDPIEINGLKRAFRELRRRAGKPELTEARCRVGSVKTQIGHLEAAAGMAGIFKVILAMKHGRIPGNLHLRNLNPHIQLEGSPLRILTGGEAWPRWRDENGRELPRRAGVSSFGFGGVNGHVLLEENLEPPAPAVAETGEHLVVLSARTEERLRESARRLARFVEAETLAPRPAAAGGGAEEIETGLIAKAAELLGVRPQEVPTDEALEDLGFGAARLRQLWDWIRDTFEIPGSLADHSAGRSLSGIARHLTSAAFQADRPGGVGGSGALSLADLAYTLQVGREEMEHRLAVTVETPAELVEGLRTFASDGRCLDGVFQGEAEGPAGGATSKTGGGTVEELIRRRDLGRLAQRWVAGAWVPWERLHSGGERRRLSLPTYPFARTRHWIPQRDRGSAPARASSAEAAKAAVGPHPLLDGPAVGGEAGAVVYRKGLVPSDRLVGEHRIHGRAVLPGVAHLEMARAAAAQTQDGPLRLTRVVWRRAVEVGEAGCEVRVRLRETRGGVVFEIEGDGGGAGSAGSGVESVTATQTYSQGVVERIAAAVPAPPRERLEAIRERCPRHLERARIYERFRSLGIDYGPYFQGLLELWAGPGEALGRVALDAGDAAELGLYTLHPTILDAALQAVTAFAFATGAGPGSARLPFSVEAVEILRPHAGSGWVHVRARDGGGFDLALLDDSGEASVVLREVSVRDGKDPLERFFFVPRWQPATLEPTPVFTPPRGGCLIVSPPGGSGFEEEIAAHCSGYGVWRLEVGRRTREIGERHWEIDAADPRALARRLRDLGEIRAVVFLAGVLTKTLEASDAEAAALLRERGVTTLFRLVQFLASSDRIQRLETLQVVVNDVESFDGRCPGNPWAAGLLGLARSLAKELPRVAVSCVDLALPVGSELPSPARAALVEAALAEPPQRDGEEVVVVPGGGRRVRRLVPVRLDRPAWPVFRRRGVFLLAGGAGGIGLTLALHLARTAEARLVLVGRRPQGSEIEARLASLTAAGGEAVYVQADVTDAAAMSRAVARARHLFGGLHGVVHAAMVLADGLLERQDEATFHAALAPKIEGSAVLGDLLCHEPLDFMLFLSSVQSFTGSAGQGNYAAASRFQDAYARALAGRVPFPVKLVNWGPWGTVGSVASEEYQQSLTARGFHPILPRQGMDALERIVAGDELQVVALDAEERVLTQIGVEPPAATEAERLEEQAVRSALEALPRVEPLEITHRDEDEQRQLDRFIAHALLSRLGELGVLRQPGERWRLDDLARELGALPKYRRLLRGLVRTLARHRLVTETAGEVVATEVLGSGELTRELEGLPRRAAELAAAFPNLEARLRLVTRCLEGLSEVITGRRLATEILFPGSSMDLVAGIYRGERLVDYLNGVVAACVRALAGPAGRRGAPGGEIRILEIGAGTGSTTHGVLEALGGLGGEPGVIYEFTDLSVRFLERAEERFGSLLPGLRLRTLDIEKPLEEQGFEAGGHDLVIASNVLHATRNLDAALTQARRLLAPGGRLILSEVTRAQDFHTVTFGLLDGWWLYEDENRRLELSPLLGVEMWKRRLEEAGFAATAVLGTGSEGRELPQRVIVAQQSPRPAAPRRSPAIADTAAVPAPAVSVPTVSVSKASPAAAPPPEPVPELIRAAQAARGGASAEPPLEHCMEILVTSLAAECLGLPPEEIAPHKPLSSFGVDSIVGVELINRLNEALGIVLKTIVIFDHPSVEALAKFIAERHGDELIGRIAASAAAGASPEPQTAELSQALPEPALPREMTGVSDPRPPVPPWLATGEPETPSAVSEAVPGGVIEAAFEADPGAAAVGFRAVRFERPGHPRDLRIVPHRPVEPGPGEVEILVRAFPINFSDFLLAKGLYPMMPDFPFTPGVEISGVVRRVGPGVTRVAPGDEVIGLTRPEMGGQASLVITDETFVVRKPANVSHEEACGFPVAFLAMYLAFERARVERGERILIQAATGTNGLVAVQLAQLAGAEIFATAGSPRKIEFLRQRGIEHAIAYREVDFASEILRLTGGEGVDVVINTLGGDALQKGLDLLAPEGRYIEIAVFGLQASKGLDLSRLVDNQSFHSFNTKKFFLEHPDRRVPYLETMASYLESGKVKPFVSRVFAFDEVLEAYAAKEDRETIGRIVVSTGQAAEEASLGQAPPPEEPRIEAAAPTAASADRRGEPLDIAVIGMSCRFPGAADSSELWRNLAGGVSSIREIPPSRWANARFFDPDPAVLDKTYCKWGGMLDDIDLFDAGFFNISGKEAAQTDPQQRLFLEEAWKALEDAGYPSAALDGEPCGVFVGVGPSEYLTRMNRAGVVKQAQSFWGNEASVLAARISYFLNLKGPSVAVNTACSSSLVALHLACQSLVTGESRLAVSGGVFLTLAPDYFIVASNGNMLSPEGKCKTFDDSANGFGPGEGVGVVVLKPLTRALEDGDHIYGVIKASAINQDGKTNGITAPSSLSQTAVELAAYERYGIHPETLGYIEAHGTGTKLGDPIEIEALTNAFRKYTDKRQFCPIGSIKTNIGHTAAAAGIAGLLKILLIFKHRQIPPSLHFERPNSHIDFPSSPFFVNTELCDWLPEGRMPRRAALSSFGFSGTNAHVVLEEPPERPRWMLRTRPLCLVPLSAATLGSLRQKIEQLAAWLDGEGARASLEEIAYHLQLSRDHFSERTGFLCRSREELANQLRSAAQAAGGAADGAGLRAAAAETGGELAEIAARYLAGEKIDWQPLWAGERCSRISMPVYPFDRERFWYTEEDTVYAEIAEVSAAGDSASAVPVTPAGLELLPAGEANGEQVLRLTLRGEEPFVRDHRVDGRHLLPGVLYLELAKRAAEAAGFDRGTVRDLVWLRPVEANGETVDLEVRLQPRDEGLEIELRSSRPGGGEVVHARCAVLPAASGEERQRVDLEAVRQACPRRMSRDEHYRRLRQMGLEHGPFLASVAEVWVGQGEVLARLRLPEEARGTLDRFALHPALLDGALQLLGAFEQGSASTGLPLPFRVAEVTQWSELPAECWARALRVSEPAAEPLRRYRIQLLDEEGRELAVLRDFAVKSSGAIASPAGDVQRSGNGHRGGNGSRSRDEVPAELLTVLQRLQAGEIGEDEAGRAVEVILEP